MAGCAAPNTQEPLARVGSEGSTLPALHTAGKKQLPAAICLRVATAFGEPLAGTRAALSHLRSDTQQAARFVRNHLYFIVHSNEPGNTR